MEFVIFFNPDIRGTMEEREQLRPIARNNERYQEMIELMRKVAVAGDELGYDALGMTEHHFNSEGWEVSVAPLLIITDLAARTKRLKFFPLGCVLPSWDPIRLAEEFAVVDHLTKGRFYAGIARGYQDRWTNILGQHYHVTATASDGSAIDQHNRSVFKEFLDIIKRAWTEVPLRLKTEHYEVPYPHESGIARWPISDTWTRPFGAPGEVDEKGVVRAVTVVPAPYQQPHPPIMQPFSFSESSVQFCAENDFGAWFEITDPNRLRELCELYRGVAIKSGRNVKLGDNCGVLRMIYLGNSYDEAYELGKKHLGSLLHVYFGGFGFIEGLRGPEDDEKYGKDQPLPPEEYTPERAWDRVVRVGFAYVGTPDGIRRQMQALYENVSPQRFAWWIDDQMPHDVVLDQVKWFAKDVMPEFKN